MCCEHRGHRGDHHGGRHEGHHGSGQRGHHHGRACGCGGPSHFERRFWTTEEKIARLESYLENLQAEAKAVQERLAELKGE